MNISINDFVKKIIDNEKIYLIDIRTKEAFDKIKIEGKSNFHLFNLPYPTIKDNPSKKLTSFIQEHEIPKNNVYAICYKGNSSKLLCQAFEYLNHPITNVMGGMDAWEQFYGITAIPHTRCTIYQIQRLAKGCLSYIIVSNNEAIIVDPLSKEDLYIDFIQKNNLHLKFIVDTHIHADHFSSGVKLSLYFNVPYRIHPYESINPLDQSFANFIYSPLSNDEIFHLGNASLTFFHIPGHTLGQLAINVDNKFLICGDSIFMDSLARPDLGRQLDSWIIHFYNTLEKIMNLPNDIILLPGHFSNLEEMNSDFYIGQSLEKIKATNSAINHFFAGFTAFDLFIRKSLPMLPKEYETIKRANLCQLAVSDQDIAVLECGKNMCSLRS